MQAPSTDTVLRAHTEASIQHISELGPQRMAQRQQRLEGLTAAVLRALAHQPRWSFALRHARLPDGSPLPWTPPHLRTETADGLPTYRAVADGLGWRQRITQPDIHRQHAPTEPIARMLYEWFEQMRIESLVPDHLPGVRANLQRHFKRWSLAWHESALIETHLGLLLFSISQMVWARLHRTQAPEEVLDTMEATRAGLAPLLGDDLRLMSRHRRVPERFSPASARMASVLAKLVAQAQAAASTHPPDRRHEGRDFFLWLDDDPAGEERLPMAATGESRSWEAQQQRYRIFTRQFDREVVAASLVRTALLQEHRQQLDRRLHELSPPIARLSRQLVALLARPQQADWRFQQEEGRIDARQLARLVASPMNRDVFRQETRQPLCDCAITLLIDCSGSMKTHATELALFADIWSRITGMAQIPFEILGFSTASWHGGKALREWRRQGRPAQPGRLAERQHLVFKTFDQYWQRTRLAIGSLLKQDLYREGLDGEAVHWASQRLLARPEKHRLLWVISDGCPMESATREANDDGYLDHHLKAMVTAAQAQGIQVTGIGLGLDLSPFYPRNLAVEPDKLLHTQSLLALMKTAVTMRR